MTAATNQRPVAVITGASSGIGEGIATQLAARGYDLILVARRTERLSALAERLRSSAAVECAPVAVDLASRDERDRLITLLESERARIEVLVNNAGFGTHGFFHETELDAELELIDVNCAAPVHLTKRILPWMLERRSGRVLNVGSMSGFAPGPVMAIYYASKAFLLSFSEALWEECRGTGVTVTLLAPGPVRTEFQGRAGIVPGARTSGTDPLPVERVAREGIEGMLRGRRVVIPGAQNRIAAFLARISPRSRALKTVRAIQEARRRHTLAERQKR
jgi:short-subunit dehydrogenase